LRRKFLITAGLGLTAGSFRVFLGSEEFGTLGHEFPVSSISFLGIFSPVPGSSFLGPLPLDPDGSDQPLDLWGLGSDLGVLVVGRQFSSDDISSDVIFFFEVEELADFVGPLGSETPVGVCGSVGESGCRRHLF